MKKKILIIVLVFFGNIGFSYATHMMGGQITFSRFTSYTDSVKLTLYRDTIGVPMIPYEYVEYADTNGIHIPGPALELFLMSVEQLGNGVEECVYGGTQYHGTHDNLIYYFSECCRNGAITNMPDPLNTEMLVFTRARLDTLNSSPVFLNRPIIIAQLGMPFYYNPLPYDANGDSLTWSLTTPLDSTVWDTLFINPVVGYTLPPSDPSMPLTIDSTSGALSFKPNTMGNFAVSTLVNEYRSGALIGQIRREMQIIVVASNNAPPVITGTSNIAPSATGQIFIPAGTTLDLSVNAADPVDADSLSIRCNGGEFYCANAATYIYTDGSGSANGSLSWTPTVSEARQQPYLTSFRTSELHGNFTFSHDDTYELYVYDVLSVPTPLKQNAPISWTIQQNLLQGFATFEKQSFVQIELIDMNGEKVASVFKGMAAAGKHQFVYDVHSIQPSIYIVRTISDGVVISNEKIVVMH